MQISVSITLLEGDSVTQTPEQIAAAVIKAIGGATVAKDLCYVTITQPPQTGTAGTPPSPLPAE